MLFIPVVITSARRIGREVRTRTRTGQDKLAEIQNILHETVTGNRIVKAFNTEIWEILRFKKAAKRLVPRQPAQRAHPVHQLAVDGYHRRHCHRAAALDRAQRDPARPHDHRASSSPSSSLLFKLYDPVRKFAYFYNSFQQAMGASASIFGFFDVKDDVKEKAARRATLHRFRIVDPV